jgi:hypothetical protein
MKSAWVILLKIIFLLIIFIMTSCAAASKYKYKKRRKEKPCDCPQFSKADSNMDYRTKSPDTLTITPNFVASCMPLKY